MATFRTLPSGKVQAQIRIPAWPAQSATHLTRELADKWAREIDRELRATVRAIESLSAEYCESLRFKKGRLPVELAKLIDEKSWYRTGVQKTGA